jgi:hypothetical protein
VALQRGSCVAPGGRAKVTSEADADVVDTLGLVGQAAQGGFQGRVRAITCPGPPAQVLVTPAEGRLPLSTLVLCVGYQCRAKVPGKEAFYGAALSAASSRSPKTGVPCVDR